jgi:hypothetical protein
MRQVILTVRTINNSSMSFDGQQYAWTFGDTLLSVYSNDKTVRYFFPFATADLIKVEHK